MSDHSAEKDVTAERVRAVLDTFWTMVLEGQSPGEEWLYLKVRECVTSPANGHIEEES